MVSFGHLVSMRTTVNTNVFYSIFSSFYMIVESQRLAKKGWGLPGLLATLICSQLFFMLQVAFSYFCVFISTYAFHYVCLFGWVFHFFILIFLVLLPTNPCPMVREVVWTTVICYTQVTMFWHTLHNTRWYTASKIQDKRSLRVWDQTVLEVQGQHTNKLINQRRDL